MGPDVPPGPLTSEPDSGRRHGIGAAAREAGQVVLVAVVFALFVRTFLVQGFVVPSSSMERTLLAGDHVLVNKFAYAPRGKLLDRLLPYRAVARGDVVVFKFPENPRRDFIKRAAALPGDLLEIRDKEVFVNGRSVSEPRVFHSEERVWRDDPETPEPLRRRDQRAAGRIGDGEYFMMGDNRDDSYDSRFWGTVPARNVKGRALFVYWSVPPSGEGRGGLARVGDFFSKARWSRSFLPVR